jgi:exodeoxyribonuclease X
MTTIAVIDVETHCFDIEEGEAKVIELASRHWPIHVPLYTCSTDSWLFASAAPVTPRASAVHHLTDEDLTGRPPFEQTAWEKATVAADYVAAHNAAFDFGIISRAAPVVQPIICTMKCARVAWPEAPSHGLQTLRYYLGLNGDLPEGLAPHRAAYDAIVCSWLLARLLDHFNGDITRMVQISNEPSLLRSISFGKQRGEPWSAVPKDYLRWVLDQDFGPDEKWTAAYWLGRQS